MYTLATQQCIGMTSGQYRLLQHCQRYILDPQGPSHVPSVNTSWSFQGHYFITLMFITLVTQKHSQITLDQYGLT